MRKNGLYLRLSIADGDLGKDNKDESNSIDNQRTLLVNFVQDRDDLSDEYIEYVDDGYSGTNFERPAFKRMIEDAKTGKIDTIIVKDFSRFGRDYIGVGDYLEQVLPILGIRFISLNNNYDSNDYLGKTMGMDMAIHNLVNNLYSKDISKKLKSALRVKWKNGQWTGGKPPFGYLRDSKTGEWLIDPVAGKYVRTIFDKAIEGCSTSQISYYMNEQKIPTPGRYNKENGLTHYGYNQKMPESEILWDCGMVRAILGRYEYTGALVQGKRQSIAVGSKVTRKSRDKDVVITKNVHPAIVSEEEYEIAKATIAFMKKPDYRGARKFALKGKVRCGNCRRSMVLMESGANDRVYCPHKKMTGKFAKCSDEMIAVSIIEGHVWYALKRVLYVLNAIQVDFEEKTINLDSVRRKKIKQLEAESNVWGTIRDGRWAVLPKSCKGFSEPLYELMGWNKDCKYKLRGQFCGTADEQVMIFELEEPEVLVQEKAEEQFAEEPEKKEEAQKLVKRILYPEAWAYNFGESTNRTVFLQRVAYRGNWDILRPARTVEGMEIITREVLDDLLESAEKLIDKMRCANYA